MFSVSYSILFRESSERNSISIPSLVIFSYKMTFENPGYIPESNCFNYDWTTYSDQEKHNSAMIYLKKHYPDMYNHIIAAAELSKVRIVENLRSSKAKKEKHQQQVKTLNEKLEKLYHDFIEAELDAGIVLSEELCEMLDDVETQVSKAETIIEFSNELAVLDDLIEKQALEDIESPTIIDLTEDEDMVEVEIDPIPVGNNNFIDITGCEDSPVSPPSLGRKRKLEETEFTKADSEKISALSDTIFNVDKEFYVASGTPFQDLCQLSGIIDI